MTDHPGTRRSAHGQEYETRLAEAVERALAALDLDAKTRLLAGQDMWSLPAFPEAGVGSLVMSDGPVGVRGVRWTAADPSVALPSPTALAASWDPELARRAGALLAQEARRKGVHVLLAPTVNLHRSPLGGRHFETYSEDPYLTGAIGTGYVQGVQSGGVGTTVKHFAGNDAETDRFTVDNRIDPRTLHEVYLAPFEAITAAARPWGVMTAYNSVNGTTMTEHRDLVTGVLRGTWGFDGINVSDWLAARSTIPAITAGLDLAMPGPRTVYGPALAAAVRDGQVDEKVVDAAVRRVLRLAGRVGVLDGVGPAVPPGQLPAEADGAAVAREVARRGFVLLRNEPAAGGTPVLPLGPRPGTVALLGAAAREARVLGGGSATVFPPYITSPLDGLRTALGEEAVTFRVGADPQNELGPATQGFDLRAVCRDADGTVLGTAPVPGGAVQWVGSDLPDGVTHETLHSVEITGTYTPPESGRHTFGTRGLGAFRLTVGGRELWSGTQGLGEARDPFEAFFGVPTERATAELTAGEPVDISLECVRARIPDAPLDAVSLSLVHLLPQRDPDELIVEAVEAARQAETAVVVVATTEAVESEGFDRTSLALPGRQDDLVRAVAAANPRTVVVVNAGSPVEMAWREEVAAVLLTWFPGQEGGAALADVLTGREEPGGRLPTTWPARLADAPVSNTAPADGHLDYTEGVFVGYAAWERAGTTPAYPFGHGLGYTDWNYETLRAEGRTVTVGLRNTGTRPGRETVQLYLAPPAAAPGAPERPAQRLAGFALAEAGPGESTEVTVELPDRAFEIWDETAGGWSHRPGRYELRAARSVADPRLTLTLKED
ncbi:glycoside hydrolase family 3 protein [Streptomyces sp. NPDC058373]|uniref:glycoside hydrolase family 3 protein n=1 Tax=Streptomyces sp. NPDC058373 TaxID=3346465 RepID=UPI0036550433